MNSQGPLPSSNKRRPPAGTSVASRRGARMSGVYANCGRGGLSPPSRNFSGLWSRPKSSRLTSTACVRPGCRTSNALCHRAASPFGIGVRADRLAPCNPRLCFALDQLAFNLYGRFGAAAAGCVAWPGSRRRFPSGGCRRSIRRASTARQGEGPPRARKIRWPRRGRSTRHRCRGRGAV